MNISGKCRQAKKQSILMIQAIWIMPDSLVTSHELITTMVVTGAFFPELGAILIDNTCAGNDR
jgi:hypothetical protein